MIICRLCGKSFKDLKPHLRHKHGKTPNDYREMFPGERLMCVDRTGSNNSMYGKIPKSKGKTMEEFYGEEVANRLKENLRIKNTGKRASEETRQKMRETRKGTNTGKDNPMYGKKHSDETRLKMSDSHVGVIPNHSEEGKQRISKAVIDSHAWRKENDPNYIEKQLRNIWDNSELKVSPLEEELISILNDILPEIYEYNGNFESEVMINGCIPDFVNINSNRAIEPYSVYWKELHYETVENYRSIREEKFRQVGWDVLFVEEGEFADRESLIEKILDFEGVKNVF